MAQRVGIIGSGAWGTAIAMLLAEKGHDVQVWARRPEVVQAINSDHRLPVHLPGVQLPKAVRASGDITEVAARRYIILATPSLHVVEFAKQIIAVPNVLEGESVIGVVTKGFVRQGRSYRLLLDALESYLPGSYKGNLVYLSGPTHAEEVASGKLTGLISASANPRNSIRFRELLSTRWFLVYSSLDVVGVQVAAAVKNVIAIAFGVLDAIKGSSQLFGDNTESLLLAAGLNEIQRLAAALGSTHPETFTSIAGVGDLDVTCRSPHGRNRRFGRDIVNRLIIEAYTDLDQLISHLGELPYLPEGVVAARAVHGIAAERDLHLPICEGVYRILNRERDPVVELERMLGDMTGSDLQPVLDRPASDG